MIGTHTGEQYETPWEALESTQVAGDIDLNKLPGMPSPPTQPAPPFDLNEALKELKNLRPIPKKPGPGGKLSLSEDTEKAGTANKLAGDVVPFPMSPVEFQRRMWAIKNGLQQRGLEWDEDSQNWKDLNATIIPLRPIKKK